MHNDKGFSLVELLLVMMLMALLMAIGIPSVLSWLPNMRFNRASRELVSALQLAKMEAVKGNTNVVVTFAPAVCPAAGPLPAPGGSYTVFVDNGGTTGSGGVAGNGTREGDERILRNETMPNNVALCTANFAGGATTGFLPAGLPIAARFGSVNIRGDKGRTITVNLTSTGAIRSN